MQSFYGQLQGFTCNGKEAQEDKNLKFQKLQKEQQRIERSNGEKVSEGCKKQEKEENRNRTPTFPKNVDF